MAQQVMLRTSFSRGFLLYVEITQSPALGTLRLIARKMLYYKASPYCNENAGALARPPATCPLCHFSKQKVFLTVIFLVCYST